MKETNDTLKTISAILMGAAGGVLMATVNTAVLSQEGASVDILPFILLIIISAGIPWCFDSIGRRGMNPILAEGIMIVLSFGICVLFSYIVSKTDHTRGLLIIRILVIHGIALAVTAVRWGIRYHKSGKEES